MLVIQMVIKMAKWSLFDSACKDSVQLLRFDKLAGMIASGEIHRTDLIRSPHDVLFIPVKFCQPVAYYNSGSFTSRLFPIWRLSRSTWCSSFCPACCRQPIYPNQESVCWSTGGKTRHHHCPFRHCRHYRLNRSPIVGRSLYSGWGFSIKRNYPPRFW